jgi:hypothetical protein
MPSPGSDVGDGATLIQHEGGRVLAGLAQVAASSTPQGWFRGQRVWSRSVVFMPSSYKQVSTWRAIASPVGSPMRRHRSERCSGADSRCRGAANLLRPALWFPQGTRGDMSVVASVRMHHRPTGERISRATSSPPRT